MADTTTRWGAKWIQRGKYADEHLLFENCMPALFLTREDARKWINQKYGYIRGRDDLRREPHCWRMPKAVRVRIEVAE